LAIWPGLPAAFLGLEQVHELDGREEPHAQVVMHDRLHADRGREMGLAGAWAADEHDVVGLLDEVAAVQRLHEGGVHRALLELEAREIAIGGEARGLELVLDRADLPLGDLGLDQIGEDALGLLERGALLQGEIGDGLRHAVEF
jgi:hypothetical protein